MGDKVSIAQLTCHRAFAGTEKQEFDKLKVSEHPGCREAD